MTLYSSRRLRFDDMFAGQYLPLFALDRSAPLRILELGCGPGALAGALRRWYPRAEITALDRDSQFIRFARDHEPGIAFLEGDVTALPFDGESFDVTISNTLSEHVELAAFFGEQRRVLKRGGVCLVLSARRGLKSGPAEEEDLRERAFWEKAPSREELLERYAVGRWAMSEAELPAAMERHGFSDVRTGYALLDLTPDDPKYPPEAARAMIEADRYNDLEAVDTAVRAAPERFDPAEAEAVKGLINARYDGRLARYARGEKLWDTEMSVTQMVRGVKN